MSKNSKTAKKAVNDEIKANQEVAKGAPEQANDNAPRTFTEEEVQQIVAQMQAQVVQQLAPKLFVTVELQRPDGTRTSDRLFVTGVRDFTTVAQIEAFEKQVVEGSNGQFVRATVMFWKRLDS